MATVNFKWSPAPRPREKRKQKEPEKDRQFRRYPDIPTIFFRPKEKNLFPVGANFGEGWFSGTTNADSEEIIASFIPGHYLPKILRNNPTKIKFPAA